MVLCFVPDCHHKSESHNCKFFRFPTALKSPKRRESWKKLIRRADRSPGKFARVCSCHFKEENCRNLPELFSRNAAKKYLFTSPEKRKRSKTVVMPQVLENDGQPEMRSSLSPTQETPLPEVMPSSSPTQEIPVLEVLPSSSPTQEPDISVGNLGDESHSLVQTNLVDEIEKLKDDVRVRDEAIAALNSVLKTKEEALEEMQKVHKRQLLVVQAEMDCMKREFASLATSGKGFTLSDIANDPKDMAHFTGLPNIEVFNLILEMFDNIELNYYAGWNVQILSKADQLFLTLFKLRRNPSVKDLAKRFKVSEGTVENTFLTWVSALHQMLFVGLMANIPSRLKNAKSKPKTFEDFSNCRIVLDCTEIFAANPRKLSDQNDRYSNYKHRITFKGLVGIAPNGTLTFLSDLYPGSVSDKTIVQGCGILDKLVPGDSVMADKGFLIGDILPPGVTLNIPPFKTTPQMTPEQIEATLSVAAPRVHVEREIRAIKTFQILDFIPGKMISFASKIFQVCGALTNFRNPLIREVAEKMKT